MSPPTRIARLKIIYGLKMSKTADLDNFFHSNFYIYMYNVCLVATLKGGGGQPASMGLPLPP